MIRAESSDGDPEVQHSDTETGSMPTDRPHRTGSFVINATKGSKPRKKRWAPKVTTGCITCRAHRVKCDETKPFCSVCMSRGRWCQGYTTPPTPQPPSSSHADAPGPESEETSPILPAPRDSGGGGGASELNRQCLSPGPKPPSWDVIEGLRYMFCVMAPEHMQNTLGNSDYDSQFVGPPTFIVEDSFLLVVTAHRIKSACRHGNVVPSPGQMASLSPVWKRFWHHMARSLVKVNQSIAGSEPAIGVFYRIMDILHVELSLHSPIWRAHVEGCAEIIRLYGGVQQVLNLSAGKPSPILAIQLILIIATMANTTSPATDQIRGFTDWNTDEIRTVYTTTMYSELPCPTYLFLIIRRINRLRIQAAAKVSYKEVIEPAARKTLASIAQFAPESWTEPYSVSKKPEMVVIAHLFKTAVFLYAVMVLSPTPSTVAAIEAAIDGDAVAENMPSQQEIPRPGSCAHALRIALRHRLLRLISEAMQHRPVRLYLAWPLAVLGVALADGRASDREMVEDYLQRISRAPQAYCGPTMSLVKLRAFWASGKLGWDDCFDEACPVLA